jgi:hypothetical protein
MSTRLGVGHVPEVICLLCFRFQKKPKAVQTVKLTSHNRAPGSPGLLERRYARSDPSNEPNRPHISSVTINVKERETKSNRLRFNLSAARLICLCFFASRTTAFAAARLASPWHLSAAGEGLSTVWCGYPQGLFFRKIRFFAEPLQNHCFSVIWRHRIRGAPCQNRRAAVLCRAENQPETAGLVVLNRVIPRCGAESTGSRGLRRDSGDSPDATAEPEAPESRPCRGVAPTGSPSPATRSAARPTPRRGRPACAPSATHRPHLAHGPVVGRQAQRQQKQEARHPDGNVRSVHDVRPDPRDGLNIQHRPDQKMRNDKEEAQNPERAPERHQVHAQIPAQRRDGEACNQKVDGQLAVAVLKLRDGLCPQASGKAQPEQPDGPPSPHYIKGPRWHPAQGTVQHHYNARPSRYLLCTVHGFSGTRSGPCPHRAMRPLPRSR